MCVGGGRRGGRGDHDTVIFTMLYLKVLLKVYLKVLKVLYGSVKFLSQFFFSSYPGPMYAEHWRKLAWATF